MLCIMIPDPNDPTVENVPSALLMIRKESLDPYSWPDVGSTSSPGLKLAGPINTSSTGSVCSSTRLNGFTPLPVPPSKRKSLVARVADDIRAQAAEETAGHGDLIQHRALYRGRA